MEENSNVYHLNVDSKRFVIIGTAHVSHESADLVERVIGVEAPDTICVELCRSRYEALERGEALQGLNFLELARRRKGLVLPWLLLSYAQRKMGRRFGIRPGEEILRAIRKAKATGATLLLVDRDIGVTLERMWSLMPRWSRLRLIAELAISLLSIGRIREEDIAAMQNEVSLERITTELGSSFPIMKQVVIDERDQYMAGEIGRAPGTTVLAVVGAAHVAGILRYLESAAPSSEGGMPFHGV